MNPYVIQKIMERGKGMVVHYEYLLAMVGSKDLLFHLGVSFQWNGHQLLRVLCYAIKLTRSYSYRNIFSDPLRLLEYIAKDCLFGSSLMFQSYVETVVSLMPFLKSEFFAVPKIAHRLFVRNPERKEIIASFIHFLVEALMVCSVHPIFRKFRAIVPGQINVISENLKFLHAVLWDTPFLCTELEENKNGILADIEFIANKVGFFLYSFFFTTNLLSETKMEAMLSFLSSRYEMVAEKIREHCITVSRVPKFMTQNTASVSIFIVDSVLDDLNHLINHRPNLIVNVKDKVASLQKELNFCRSIIRDIEVQQDEQLIECVMQLRDMACDVQYINTGFAVGDVPDWYLTLRLSNFIKKNELIRTTLQEIKLSCGIKRIEVMETLTETSYQFPKGISLVEDIIVGFDEKTTEITSQLVGKPDHLLIISIVGMSGVGKTTLAKKLYNDSRIIHHFHKRSWCVVSQTFRKTKLLIEILGSTTDLNVNEISSIEEDELGEHLYKSLKGRRYLLVMDDIWNKEVWTDLRRYFPDDRNGSRILFTSQNKDVALQASANGIVNELPLLQADECWILLKRKVFQDSLCPPGLQAIGMDIARNCKGLPLAVVGIAAVLQNKEKNESLWKEVATTLSSYISKNKDILVLSYQHLPTHLKPCFLYFGMFEEDSEIPVTKLFSLWISQGFIPKKEEKSLEDVAEDYLLELINRSMVQVAKRRCDNRIKACNIHDLIHHMCLRIAEEENFLKVIKVGPTFYEHHHHLYVHSLHDHTKLRPFGPHIRSLFIESIDGYTITSRLELLRVLKLLDAQNSASIYIGLDFLVNLRYLEVEWFTPTLSSHENLEFLYIAKSLNHEVFLDMPNLRHLSFLFPVRLSKVWDISQTSRLETLSGIIMYDSSDEERVRGFSDLHHLKCEYDNSWNFSPDLSSLTQLESLKIVFRKHFNSIPITVNIPSNVKKLALYRITLSGKMMLSIRTLPNLEILKLYYADIEGDNWITDDHEFQKLKFLKLKYLYIPQWNTSRDHFPRLEKLVLRSCYGPKVLPSELGYIPTLQMIEVYNCDHVVTNSAIRIHEEQLDEGNEELKFIIFS